jgi:predicted TIM-barrel fold metal-dependent hydrolase
MYNQWLADFVSCSPSATSACAPADVEHRDAIKEAQWARDHGLKGINFPAESGEDQSSHRAGRASTSTTTRVEPFWAAVNDLDMAFCTHGGAGEPDEPARRLPHLAVRGERAHARPVHRMLFAGVFDRYPNLRIVVTEQPGQWFKVKMDDLDSLQWMANMPKKPSEYIREHVFLGASFMSRFEAEDAIENDYWQNVIWGTDYPHIEGVWKYLEDKDAEPHSHMGIRFAYAGLDGEKVKAMLGLNGVRVYGFDGDHLHKVAQTINAPTLDDINHPSSRCPKRAGMWAFAPSAPSQPHSAFPSNAARPRGHSSAGSRRDGPSAMRPASVASADWWLR